MVGLEYVETERITSLLKGNQIDSSKFSQLPGTAIIVKGFFICEFEACQL